MSSYLNLIEKEKSIPTPIAETLRAFYNSYMDAGRSNGFTDDSLEKLLLQFVQQVVEQLKNPYSFESYHQQIIKPFDHYQFGLDFIRPLVIMDQSRVVHKENLQKIQQYLLKGENVIFLANHQTELDPQAINILLEKEFKTLAQQMISVAGHRVVSDPLAVPFSKGCNLLCIFSRKYIEDSPDKKEERLQHNQKTMMRMSQLLSEGGKCIYVAPSGGRDRPNDQGIVEVAPFDGQNIELFWLMTQRASRATHFFPLALATYDLLPPPDEIKKTLGEPRVTKATPIHLACGPEVDMTTFPGSDLSDKKERRNKRAEYIWNLVHDDFQLLGTK